MYPFVLKYDIPPDGWARHVLYAGIDGPEYWNFNCKGSSTAVKRKRYTMCAVGYSHCAGETIHSSTRQERRNPALVFRAYIRFRCTVRFTNTILYFTPYGIRTVALLSASSPDSCFPCPHTCPLSLIRLGFRPAPVPVCSMYHTMIHCYTTYCQSNMIPGQ